MGKEEVAIVGTGPAGLVAAFALHNDLNGRFNVTVFEVVGFTMTGLRLLELTVHLESLDEPRRPLL